MRFARRCIGVSAVAALVGGCDGSISGPGGSDQPGPHGDPGRVTVHRLNNTEYANTIRDLLGTELNPAADFPADDYSYGFDNIAEVLSVSPVQVELYQRAAHELAVEAMHDPIFAQESRVEAEEIGGTVGAVHEETSWILFLPGRVETTMVVPEPGTYQIKVRAWADQAGPELAKMELSVDGRLVRTFEVEAPAAAPVVYTIERELAAGAVGLSAAFPNDFHHPEEGLDRNLYIDWIAIEGPTEATGETPIRDRIMVCQPDPADPEPCVREIIETFGTRAWRRPLTDEELATALELYQLAIAEGGDLHEGIQLVIEDFLASPHFLFRFEIDPDPTSMTPRPLDDWELASRLSYFIWSSMPDDELFAAAKAGTLRRPDELEFQIERMLADPKAQALVDNFAGQWLYLRGLAGHEPDLGLYPSFDDSLRAAMIEETKRFFREFLENGLPVHEMLTADFSFVNERLAAHYGIPVEGSGFQKVSLAGTGRSGLLGQASILTVTSHPDRTSPVKRGQWVLEQLLCSAPPPPPPGVEGLEMGPTVEGSVRQRMEQHASDPLCASCHESMDPIGFSLEHFDPIGNWRDMDGQYPIDATGVLPDGSSFDGAVELAEVLARDPRFTHCLTEKMLIYALGRGLESFDQRTIDRIHREFLASGASLSDLIALVATSDPFLYRRGQPALEGEK